MMKCEVAKDLMTLLVEGMCSAETQKELEAHLQECTDCAKQFERLQKELSNDAMMPKTDYSETNAAALKPMKKVKKKLLRRKIVVIILGIIIAAILGVIALLSYGQMTNRCLSFSAIADGIKVKSVCKSLAKGDTQALLDVLAFRIEDIYQVRNEGALSEGLEAYKQSIKESMDETYAFYFEGKDIRVKIDDLYMTPYDENIAENLASTSYVVGFYEGDELVYSMEFGKISPKKFIVYETTDENKPNFTANLLPYDNAILDICLRHANTRQYDSLVAGKTVDKYCPGLLLGIEKSGTEEERAAFSDDLRERITRLYEEKWYFKEILYAPEEFHVEKNRWIYKVWFQVEDQNTGTIAMLEQRFAYYNGDMYILEEEEPTIMATMGEVPATIEKQLLELFR